MKYFFLGLIITFASLTACDNTYDFIKEISTPPALYFNSNPTTNTITDSLKISFKNIKRIYTFALTGVDPQSRLSGISYTVQGPPNAQDSLLLGGEVLKGNFGTVQTNQAMDLSFETPTVGNYTISFTATNGFASTGNATLNLFVFNNLIPVASFVAAPSQTNGTYAYTFDGSKSYDQDRDFGGSAKEFQYTINNSTYGAETILVDTPITLFVFPGPGSYSVSLIVYDNDGAPSAAYNLPSPIVVQ